MTYQSLHEEFLTHHQIHQHAFFQTNPDFLRLIGFYMDSHDPVRSKHLCIGWFLLGLSRKRMLRRFEQAGLHIDIVAQNSLRHKILVLANRSLAI